jgi:hypothetical protein
VEGWPAIQEPTGHPLQKHQITRPSYEKGEFQIEPSARALSAVAGIRPVRLVAR